MNRTITKYQFKVCEAVHLGIDHYFMEKGKKTMLTSNDIDVAKKLLPTLPDKWWLQKFDWMSVKH